jgi:acyl carrier protein
VLATFGITVRPAPTRCSDAVVRLGWAGGGADLVTDNAAQAPQLLLHALAGLFTAGADLRLAALATPGTPFDPDVPTYPFQRTRLWIDEQPVTAAGTAAPETVDSLTTAGSVEEIVEVLMEEVARALGNDAVDPNESFIDAGGDSFTVMLFVKGVRERFGVELSPEDFESQDAITEQVDSVARLVASAGGRGR